MEESKLKIFSLDETLTQLENLWEWVDAEGKLDEVSEDQISILYSALMYLRKIRNVTEIGID
jgi:hypothetical protein